MMADGGTVQRGVLKGDGWMHNVGLSDRHEVDEGNPRLEVFN